MEGPVAKRVLWRRSSPGIPLPMGVSGLGGGAQGCVERVFGMLTYAADARSAEKERKVKGSKCRVLYGLTCVLSFWGGR